MSLLKTTILLVLSTLAAAQENAQTRVPDSLLECYQLPELLQRDSRLPMSMATLVDLLRKVENNPGGYNMDMKSLTISLIHRFRLDGIVKASRIAPSNKVVPYSPKGFQFFKHKLLLSSLIPGNALQFPNVSLSAVERCTLHHMLSNTVEEEVRGDEGSICGRLSQYRTQRLPRHVRKAEDVEIMDLKHVHKLNSKGSLRMDLEADVSVDVPPGVYNTPTGAPISQCPVEDGVVRSQWGAVSVGALLSGIAAGLQPQKVTLRDLAPKSGDDTPYASTTVVVDNKFAATLAGDLAELALRQGPESSSSIKIGAGGGWNSTQAPRWYFLSQSQDYELSDAEIRGGLDGLILGTNIAALTGKASGLKLSQLLDMYYSQRGVFSDKLRACNRKPLLTEVAATEALQSQVYGFSLVLDQIMQLPGTISESGFQEFSQKAVDALYSYIPGSLNDLSCSATATSGTLQEVEAATNIYIVLDAMWTFPDIYPSLSYLLENLNVSPLGSTVYMMNAKDGNVVVNSTNYLSDFHSLYNYTVHQKIPPGLDLPRVLQSLKQLMTASLNSERSLSWSGGNSSVVLMVTSSAGVSEADVNYSVEQLRIFSEEIPDLRFLYMTAGSKDRFNSLVKDPARDLFTLTVSSSDSSASQVNGVIKRIKEIPRRLINHRCGSEWTQSSSGSSTLQQYAAPTTINYYRLHPNYFYGLETTGVVKIQGAGYGPMTVCQSRTVELPRNSNSSISSDGVSCQPLTTNTIEIPLGNMCKDVSYIHRCAPLYFSVEAMAVTEQTQTMRCIDTACRYPDSMKFSITLQDLGCYSAADKIAAHLITLLMSLTITFKYLF